MLAFPCATGLIAEHELSIGTFKCYPNLVIGCVNQGVKINLDNALPVMAIGVHYYNESNPVVYLSDRQNSYSIDPTLHLDAHKLFPFVLGYGVVAYNELNYRVAQLETRFLPCPGGVFRSMEAGLKWAQELIEEFLSGSDQR